MLFSDEVFLSFVIVSCDKASKCANNMHVHDRYLRVKLCGKSGLKRIFSPFDILGILF